MDYPLTIWQQRPGRDCFMTSSKNPFCGSSYDGEGPTISHIWNVRYFTKKPRQVTLSDFYLILLGWKINGTLQGKKSFWWNSFSWFMKKQPDKGKGMFPTLAKVPEASRHQRLYEEAMSEFGPWTSFWVPLWGLLSKDRWRYRNTG